MKGVTEVAKYDAGPLASFSSFRIKLIELPLLDDWFVIAITVSSWILFFC